jgi:uncharacterized protein YdcH (DUF465 family)
MFENEQNTVDLLLTESSEFRRLYDKHTVLKLKVQGANGVTHAMEQLDLEELKKEKLSLKDKMLALIKDHQSMQA